MALKKKLGDTTTAAAVSSTTYILVLRNGTPYRMSLANFLQSLAMQ